MKIGIANVGVNTSHRRLRSPIFEDGTFEFVPFPYCSPSDCPDELGNCSNCREEYTVFPRYCELPSSNGIEFSEFIPPDRLKMRTHNDPEFQSFTYGDILSNSRASNLKKLDPGDRLFFLARLVQWSGSHFTNEAGFYLIGFLDIDRIYDKYELEDMVKSRMFDEKFERIKKNAHMLMAKKYPEFWLHEVVGWKGSWIFTGSRTRSRRFTYAVPFNRELTNEVMRDKNNMEWTWPKNLTELHRIGSYTRSCRIIEDKLRIDKLYRAIEIYNPDLIL